ncbi:MAG: phenylalanine--tRNA ligase subunit beta [Burkholderiaceae bacterium]|nr:phenylalanine--tRNA ligase subunit beta [Burkholderiaceae bacterium]
MKISENWLRAYCSPDWSSEALAENLTMAGMEVEESTSFAPPFAGVVVARVHRVVPHPDADKLRVCEVDVGRGEHRKIVCGAPNVAEGIVVPCALPGAVLPGGFEIKPVRMRGVESDGMLCSARELGLSDDHSGLMLLDESLAPGTDFRVALDLDEQVFLLKLTPNLAHCLSVFGVAREVSALSGAALTGPGFVTVEPTIEDRLPVTIEAADLCGRFSGRVIRRVDARAPTPAWMRQRLERAGQRSISALVDISNYVMLELGRPSHVFDLDRIHGGLTVRWAHPRERLELLNGQTVELDTDVGVIVDEAQVESLAGIMGGESTAVTLETTNIYLEAAFWWPEAIAGRARRYNFSTDASHRFERGVDPASTLDHLEYLTSLIVSVCGGQAGPADDQVTALPENPRVRLRADRVRQVIGVEIPDSEIIGILSRLSLDVVEDGGDLIVRAPSWRFDIAIEEDLIEEVARVWGYQRLPLRPPTASAGMRAAPEGRRSALSLKQAIAARDFQEVINYSFVDGELDERFNPDARPVRLLNPIASQMNTMRTSLLGGLVETLRANLNRKASRVRIFEVGRVFEVDAGAAGGPLRVEGVAQPSRVAALAYGSCHDEQWASAARAVDFFDLKGDLEALLPGGSMRFESAAHPALHPGRCARVFVGGNAAGWIGELHPALQQALELPRAPVLWEMDLSPMLEVGVPRFEEVSRFPPAIRDIAVVVDASLSAQRVADAIADECRENDSAHVVKNIKLFDEYRGKGLENKEKSLAFRLWMQDTRKTLSEAEAATAVTAVVARLEREFGARLRSGS